MPIFTGDVDGLEKIATGWIAGVERRMKRYGVSHVSFNVDARPKARKSRVRKTAERLDLLASLREQRSERAVKARVQ